MKVLYFTNDRCRLEPTIPEIVEASGDTVVTAWEKLALEFIEANQIEFIVSDRSEYLIRQPIIDALPNRIVNLHPSFLPWNRGYHPNYWACVDKTPFGVTIHRIDAGIDTGEILAQTRLAFSENDTLRSTYDRLRTHMVGLFRTCWPMIRENRMPAMPQEQIAQSFHLKSDFDDIFDKLPRGWDTKISDL